ncbi:hypothetical protein ISS22_00715 [candidate division KSB1 bacterium]|nr:hypothetical protein [candidate division KSB1 bacterium]
MDRIILDDLLLISVCPKKVCFVIPAIFCAGISWFYAQDSGIPLRSNRNNCFLGHTLIRNINDSVDFMPYKNQNVKFLKKSAKAGTCPAIN